MSRINIRVTPNSRKNSIEQSGDILKIKVTASAIDGKANKAIIELLASHFGIRRSAIRIIKGEKGRDKIIEIIS